MSTTETPDQTDTDEETDIRLIKRGAHASGSKYHRPDDNEDPDPACNVTTESESAYYVPWPTERARAWRDPCGSPECYPDGDGE